MIDNDTIIAWLPAPFGTGNCITMGYLNFKDNYSLNFMGHNCESYILVIYQL